MFDKVVMHCSDPLRSDLVLEVLNNFKEMIKQGRILFIFSKHIKNIKQDFRKYIEDKESEYSGESGYFSEIEAQSLRPEYASDDYYDKVIELLDLSPFLVRKMPNTEYSFSSLVMTDLSTHGYQERIFTTSDLSSTRFLSSSMSLYQLLHIRVARGDNSPQPVFQPKIINNIQREIKRHLNQKNVISRSAIVEAMKKQNLFTDDDDFTENIKDAITLRMDILYCRMNCGNHLILEFHPAYEYRGSYQLDCFKIFIKILNLGFDESKLSKDWFNDLCKHERINSIRNMFIASMSDNREIVGMNVFDGDTTEYKDKFEKSFEELIRIRKNQYLEELGITK